MPNINEFVGPIPTPEQHSNLEKLAGIKPCAKCDKDSEEYFWDPTNFIVSWTCPEGHANSYKVS